MQISSGKKRTAKMEVPLPLLPLESLRTRVFVMWPHYQLVVGSFVRTGVRSPFFGPKSLKLAVFGCQKMGLWTPKSENGHRFLSPSIPKNDGIDTCFTWTSFSGEFWANFENRVFRLIFGQFPLKKSQNQKCVVHLLKYRDIGLKIGAWLHYLVVQVVLK